MCILEIWDYENIYCISDLHWRKNLLIGSLEDKWLIDENKNIQIWSNDYLIINWDIFDRFCHDNVEKDSFNKWLSLAYDLIPQFDLDIEVKSKIIQFIWDLENERLNKIISSLLERMSYQDIIKEVIYGLLVVELLIYLDAQKERLKSNLVIILGNHDYDFLSWSRLYRSLQKNVISWFYFNQFWIEYLELKELKRWLKVIESDKLNFKKHSFSKITTLFWEYFAVLSKKNVYTHSWIPKELMEWLCTSDYKQIIHQYIKWNPLRFLECDDSERPSQNIQLIWKYLKALWKENLVVWHNAFLWLELLHWDIRFNLEDPIVKEYIKSIRTIWWCIIKLDCWWKYTFWEANIFKEVKHH